MIPILGMVYRNNIYCKLWDCVTVEILVLGLVISWFTCKNARESFLSLLFIPLVKVSSNQQKKTFPLFLVGNYNTVFSSLNLAPLFMKEDEEYFRLRFSS